MLAKAWVDLDAGEYRWVAEAVTHVVFADPDNTDATSLLADSYEQMGYQAESGPWRNYYLAGATELRHGVTKVATPNAAQKGLVASMSVTMFLNALAVRLNAPNAAGVAGIIHLFVQDDGYPLELSNGALHNHVGATSEADATIRMPRSALDTILAGGAIPELVAQGTITLEGDPAPVQALLANLDTFEFWFPIVTP